MSAIWTFDLLLAAGLVTVAGAVFFAASLFTGVVLFIAFGLLMALAWVRLDASDIALAEAAIGAGLTGALLLDALGHVAERPADANALKSAEETEPGRPSRAVRILLAAAVAGLVAALGWAVLHLPVPYPGLADAVLEVVGTHPVDNAATVVLLDLRAYDTFLEMAVLLVAVLGAVMLKARALDDPKAALPTPGTEILDALARWLAPFMVLVAGYLLWAGTSRSGGAFPAGAMLGAAGILLFLANIRRDVVADTPVVRLLLSSGLLAFLVAAVVALAAGSPFLSFGEWAYQAIVALEVVLTISIAITIAMLYGASAKESSRPIARSSEAPR